MSRTDKDRPYWMRYDNYRPVHHWTCSVGREPCSLPPELYEGQAHYRRRLTACYWDAPDERHFWQQAPPKWYIDHNWHNPERVRERDTLRRIAQDYNANGDTELEMANFQARNRSKYNYW
jgi:hypothetical protein